MGKKLHKTRRESAQNQERIKLRMKSDVPLCFGFVLSELWKPNKTRSCGKEATQNQENPCKLLLHKPKNEIRCSTPLRICIKRVVEAKQNQELWERSYTNQERIHANRSKVRIKFDVLLRFGFVLSELWKPNKTRSCGKEATQNQENPCKPHPLSDS